MSIIILWLLIIQFDFLFLFKEFFISYLHSLILQSKFSQAELSYKGNHDVTRS